MESAGGARRREPVAIDDIGFAADLGRLGDFRQCRAMFGVDRATIAVEQACPAEKPGTVPQSGQRDTLVGRRAHQVDELVAGLQFCPVTAADDQ
ncbi:hypothetical protein D3C80_1722630 [compost metagenome]